MDEIVHSDDTISVKYTVKVDLICDMPGYSVDVLDKFNSRRYTLSGIYTAPDLALKDADKFINQLFEQETSMLIN